MPPLRRAQLKTANRIFVDREGPQRIFEEALFAIPPDRSILRVFYGVGGQGKTALCRELMRKTDAAVDPTFRFLRRAELDLRGRTREDPDRLLVWIRNGFADAGVAFPCFDLAFAIAWEATRGDEALPNFSRPWLSRATAIGRFGVDEGVPIVQAMVGELIGSIPGIGFALKRIGSWTIEKGKRIYLERTQEALKELYRGAELRKPYELSSLLPWMLAQDLNAHIRERPDERFVLLIDEYERVFDEGGAGSKWEVNPFDAQMQTLVAETNGMLAVFFSREQLPWARDPRWRDDLDGNQHLLGGLAEADADLFLKAIPIEDERVRRALIAGARESGSPGSPVYPLMLDLQVAHWSSLVAAGSAPLPRHFSVKAETFDERRIEIVRRVLRDYGAPLQATLERLSVARRFDRPAFEHVVRRFGTGLTLDQFDRLAELSFVAKAPDGFLSIHSLVAEAIRTSLPQATLRSSAETLLEHYAARAAPATPRDITQDTIAALVEASHLRAWLGIEGYVAWLDQACGTIFGSGWSKDIVGLWQTAATLAETELGPDHLDTAVSLNNLAALKQHLGDRAAARAGYERALAILRKNAGPEHPDTVATLTNLATLLHDMGDYAPARQLYEHALSVRERVLGPDHPSTATGLDNLAALLFATGDHQAARPLFERALAIRETALGPEHPKTVISLGNLAAVMVRLGNFADARRDYERALAIRENVLGPEHPGTATALYNLGHLAEECGDFDAALPLYARAYAIREKALGPGHPETATSMSSLAALHRELGDVAAARRLFEAALAIRESVLGSDHPDTNRVRVDIATLDSA